MRDVATEPKPGFLERVVARVPGLGAAANHIPPREFARYLLVGVCNTAFGYGTFVAFTAFLMPRVPHGYLPASVLSGLLNITVSFLGYKWFVFRTQGNYLKEWLRCLTVYSGSMLLNLLLLPFAVAGVRRLTGNERLAPYIAGALVMMASVIYTFFGHKKFSFRRDAPSSPPAN